MKRVLAQLSRVLERFRAHIIAVALLLVLAYSLFAGSHAEPPELTKKNVQQALVRRPGHIVPHKALRYTGEDGWMWESKKVLFLWQKSDTYAVVRIEEGGVKRKPFFHEFFDHSRSDYNMDTRIVDYELRRESVHDNWRIDTTDGKPLRKYWFVKYYLKFENNGKK